MECGKLYIIANRKSMFKREQDLQFVQLSTLYIFNNVYYKIGFKSVYLQMASDHISMQWKCSKWTCREHAVYETEHK